MPEYEANPVKVTAYKITGVVDQHTSPAGGVTQVLELENGQTASAGPDMTARFFANKGDYWVRQEDGYEYLNPKAVFERKYHLVRKEGKLRQHPFWILAEKQPKTDAEKITYSAVARESTTRFSALTPEGTYDALLKEAEKVLTRVEEGKQQ